MSRIKYYIIKYKLHKAYKNKKYFILLENPSVKLIDKLCENNIDYEVCGNTVLVWTGYGRN